MATEREKIYECEVKRRRVRAGGGYEPFWKVKTLAEALADLDTEFRCKDCGGAVKVLGKHGKPGTVPFVEHKDPSDAAYCISGMGFLKSTDGRVSRVSHHPVLLRKRVAVALPVPLPARVPVALSAQGAA